MAGQVYGRYHRSAPAEVIAQLQQKRGDDGRAAAGHALWLTLALELLNLLDADDFAEAEAYTEGTPKEKLRRLILNRCTALPPKMEDLYDVFLRQVEKTAGSTEARSFAALITLSRNGWREEDLQKLLAPAAAVLFPGRPPVAWDALRFAIWRRFFRAHLVTRGEHRQLDFTHVSLRQAVAGRLSGKWAPQPGQDPRPALHSAMADYLEAMPSGAPVRVDEIMWQMLGTRDLPRFARYYASPESGSGRLAEYLIEESRPGEHPLLDFVRATTRDEEMPQEVQAAIGSKFNFDLHSALVRTGLEAEPELEIPITAFVSTKSLPPPHRPVRN